ncbi:conserved hypothetical protein [Theileria equi strain WA]|uniref:RanBD1 domain-containing protein n=1 Tax=Theileria equi strain WA TaxID=1537102 RepID=L1LCM3_THEEQ|nr:conserved hypothetical protein [Theileria equi strain WA]EKX73091.1 conserved hypothetical protein [Theileria equi strain WA]|eukprot:XP_004832543.1 conserved hypothetical protein [Theileria equi strain WA]
MLKPEDGPSQTSEVPEKENTKEDSPLKTDEEAKDNPCQSETEIESAKDGNSENDDQAKDEQTLKRKRDDSEEDDTKRLKPEDVTKSGDKEGKVENSILNLYSDTKDFTCPIAKLAQMNPGDGFFKPSQTFGSNAVNTPFFTGNPEDADANTNEPEEKVAVTLESSISEDEKLLYEGKEGVKLSVFKDNEWTMATPVIIQLISDKKSEKKRIVCFQCGTGRLLLNTILLPTMSVSKLRTRAIIFNGQSISDNTKLLPHRIVFFDGNIRDKFLEIYSK